MPAVNTDPEACVSAPLKLWTDAAGVGGISPQ
jgi:hypothetical protein